jgi:hypothetical protein
LEKIAANTFYHNSLCKIKCKNSEKIYENSSIKMVKFTNLKFSSPKTDKKIKKQSFKGSVVSTNEVALPTEAVTLCKGRGYCKEAVAGVCLQ